MDVRAADTSSLAAKRLEMDSIKPIKEKQRDFMQDDAYIDKVKPQKDQKKEHKHNNKGGDAQDENESNPDHVLDAKISGLSGDEHILDVKV